MRVQFDVFSTESIVSREKRIKPFNGQHEACIRACERVLTLAHRQEINTEKTALHVVKLLRTLLRILEASCMYACKKLVKKRGIKQ